MEIIIIKIIFIVLISIIIGGSLTVAFLYSNINYTKSFYLGGKKYYIQKSVRHYYRGTEYLVIKNEAGREFVISKNVLLKALQDEQ